MSQPDPKKTAMTSLEQLKASGTVVVADTGDFEAIAKCKPRFCMILLMLYSWCLVIVEKLDDLRQ